ncbi:YhbY family RNA-binding protein [Fluviispira multicolorata]|uniref:Ribosome assembly RNA-binding protein YhbY n=1 Tax=Fluviispira multicolorata TaxID=2654512 RepID=A0A833N2W6_9BACT|nr:YhbY family RNA-binding protein [Fluviispira multicolorata]KAB8033338.1 ribosome assembly RNA-binding protein YhbY [Fluviispira multicolorata]
MAKEPKAHKFCDTLSSEQKAKLKGKAHHLKPVVQVGTQGLSETVLKEIQLALDKHELIKVQLPGNSDAESKNSKKDEISQILPKNTHVIGRIGRSLILYFEKDPSEAKITLKRL